MTSSIFLLGSNVSWAPYVDDGCFSSEFIHCIHILSVPSLAVPLSIDAQRPSLVLALAGAEDFFALCVLLPAPISLKLFWDRAKDRLGMDRSPLCQRERRGRDESLHRRFPNIWIDWLCLYFGAVTGKATDERSATA
jgi:hypothetical protein